MSAITDLLLLTNDEPDSAPIQALHAWCDEHASGQRFVPIDMSTAGGHKVFCTEVYACAGNYFPWKELLAAIPSFGWSYPETTALVLNNEHTHMDRWHAVHADGAALASASDPDE